MRRMLTEAERKAIVLSLRDTAEQRHQSACELRANYGDRMDDLVALVADKLAEQLDAHVLQALDLARLIEGRVVEISDLEER